MTIHFVPEHDVFAETSADGMSRVYTSRRGPFDRIPLSFGSTRRQYVNTGSIIDQRRYNEIITHAERTLPGFTTLKVSGRTITISSDMVLTSQQCTSLDNKMEQFSKQRLPRRRDRFVLVAMPTNPVR